MVRRSPTLARQAALEVVDGIRSGSLAGDDGLLPSEAALSVRLGVSRATLREALSQLEQGGLIVRRHGIGTFVSPGEPLLESGLEELESIETLAKRIGVEIHMGECDIQERTASAAEAELLRVPEGTAVLAVRRVMLSEDRPVAFLVDIVPADVVDQDELRHSFHGSVLDLLLSRGGPALTQSHTELTAEAADAELARSLRLLEGEPLLRLSAQLYTTDGRIVDYSLSHFIPGHFRFHVVRRVGQRSPLAAEFRAASGERQASGEREASGERQEVLAP